MERLRGVDHYDLEELFTGRGRGMRGTTRALVDEQVLAIIRTVNDAGGLDPPGPEDGSLRVLRSYFDKSQGNAHCFGVSFTMPMNARGVRTVVVRYTPSRRKCWSPLTR